MDIYLSLGSNLGDRRAILKEAVRRLEVYFGYPAATSEIIETEPVGFTSPHPFLNMCARFSLPGVRASKVRALRLLDRCKGIEAELGRTVKDPVYDRSGARVYSDRPIDIDILFFGAMRLDSPSLAIPHPRILERSFVTVPLASVVRPALKRAFPEYFTEAGLIKSN